MNYDCSQNGYYFVIVCTKDRIDYFFNYSVVAVYRNFVSLPIPSAVIKIHLLRRLLN